MQNLSKPNRLHAFPRLASVTSFPALGIGYKFSRAWHPGYMFSRAWHQLHVFSRLALVSRFPALGTGYKFSRAWHRLHFSRAWYQLENMFPRLFGSINRLDKVIWSPDRNETRVPAFRALALRQGESFSLFANSTRSQKWPTFETPALESVYSG